MSDPQGATGNKTQAGPGRPPTRKCLSDALRIAVNAKGTSGEKKVREIAEKLVNLAVEGDLEATKIIFDRLEGKAPQPVVGEEDNPIVHALKVRFV